MNKFYSYINSAIYNIRHNKAYAAFCILGTSLTFVFISIVLQLAYETVGNVPPSVNADREIYLNTFKNDKGQGIGGLTAEEIPVLLDNLKDYELCAYRNQGSANIFSNDKLINTRVAFVNGDYWKINEFDFIAGRPFTEEEVVSKTPVVILKKGFVESNFKTDEILGQKLRFDDVVYTIIGIVNDYSFLFSESQVWIPSTFNKFVTTPKTLHLYILPQKDIAIDEFKDKIVSALKFYYKNKSIDIDIEHNDILTQQERRVNQFGGSNFSSVTSIFLLILLLIPAINIVTISVANINNRAKEIAIRRSMGATILSSFILIMIENLLLVMLGTVIGVALATPSINIIINSFFSEFVMGDMSLITTINLKVLVFGVFPLLLLFTLLSGGIPAYLAAKGKIAKTLKGGSKC